MEPESYPAPMPPQPGYSQLTVKEVGEVAVVRLSTRSLSDEGSCEATSDQLFSMVSNEGRRKVLLDFTDIERLDSAMVASLIWLHKRVTAAGGRLALCNLNPVLARVFKTLQLHRVLNIYGEEQEALQSF